jgi:dTDP-4-dehydrorhamnose reductase
MKILITGASGQLGTELRPELRDQAMIFSTDFIQPNDEVERFIPLDLSEAGKVESLLNEMQPQVIVNTAAYTAVDKAESEAALAMKINADVPALLARWASRNDAFLLHYSTDYVFDGKSTRPYLESDTPAPLNAYGDSKLAGERAILASGCRHVILRTSWIYSAHGNNFVRTMLRLAKERSHLNIVNDQLGCPTWARNLARVTAMVIKQMAKNPEGGGRDEPESGLYHYCDRPACTWYDFAKSIFRAAESNGLLDRCPQVQPVTSDQFQTAAIRPRNSVLDTGKIEATFGIEPADLKSSLWACLEELSIDD